MRAAILIPAIAAILAGVSVWLSRQPPTEPVNYQAPALAPRSSTLVEGTTAFHNGSSAGATNFQDAAAWAQHISDPVLREQTVAEVATAWADEDPKSAADFLLSFTAPGQLQNNAAIGIVQRLAVKDPEKAAAWAQNFPNEARERAFEQIARIRGAHRGRAE